MEFFVITQRPALIDIGTQKLKLRSYTKNSQKRIFIRKKTNARYINVSSHKLTEEMKPMI